MENSVYSIIENINQRVYEKFQKTYQFLKKKDIELADSFNKLQGTIYFTNPKNTLKKSPIYFLGLNPGGKNENRSPINKITEKISKDDYCCFLDEKWSGKNTRQIQVRKILTQLLKDISLENNIRNIFATNLYFFRTHKANDLKKYINADAEIDCWEYHKEFLKIVQPRIILCDGNGNSFSTFSEIKKKFNINNKSIKEPIGRNWVKYFEFNPSELYSSEKVLIIGIPHLSYPRKTADISSIIKKIYSESFPR